MSVLKRAGDITTLDELFRAGLYITERDGERIFADAADGQEIRPDHLVRIEDPEPEAEAEP